MKMPEADHIAVEQPYGVEIHTTDGLFIKQMAIPKAGTLVPQHTHVYDHTSMLAVGRVRVWAGDEYMGEFTAPTGIMIKAGIAHSFLSLDDDTVIYCLHNLHDAALVSLIDAEAA